MAQKKELSEEEQAAKLSELGVERRGKKLTVPEDVDYSVAIKALTLKMEEENEVISVDYNIDRDVAEGMVAFLRVLENEFGFVSNTGRDMGWFGRQPPEYLGIETEPGKKESIPIGRLRIPGITGWLTPTYQMSKKRVVFRIFGEVKGKDRRKVDAIVDKVKEECEKNSIYKGHAIMTSFPVVDECDNLSDTFPQFARLSSVRPDEVVFSGDTDEQITVSLYMPIQKTQACRDHNIPLKRGILLEGPYGVGKTLTAAATATMCREHGWTFIYLKDVTRLSQAYAFAEHYQPAVIFAEDIDQILKDEKRNSQINDVLNALDGIDSRGMEVITVLTTNHLEKITRAMLRPGRLDTVVSVRAPDQEAAIRLVELYAGDRLAEGVDLTQAGELLAGEIPALIREVVERSKLAALRRDGELKLVGEDIEVIAKSMKSHMNLLKPQEPDTRSEEVKAAEIVAAGHVRAATIRTSDLREEEKKRDNGGLQPSSGGLQPPAVGLGASALHK
jgi:transitional endoplasmic reticulum ATPase